MSTQDESLPPVAILAGGLATRLRPLTEHIPKALVEVAGKPFIAHQLELLRRRGIGQVVICAGYLGEMIQEQVGNGQDYGLVVAYSFDGPQLLGTAGALKKALPLLPGSFFVLYGDSYLDCDYAAIYRAFVASDRPGLMAVYRNNGRWDRSNVVFTNDQIMCYDKQHSTPDMQYIDYGLGILRASALNVLPPDHPVDLADVYAGMVCGNALAGYEVSTRFFEIGSPDGLAELRRLLDTANDR